MIVDGPCTDTGTDILSEAFEKQKAVRMLRSQALPVCYTLMDQSHFAGVGNMIKNEALYNARIHPLEVGKNLNISQAKSIVDEVVKFSKKWLEWKMSSKETFYSHMSIYMKFECPLGHQTTRGHFGSTELKRVTIWCPECQPLKREMALHKELLGSKGKRSNAGVKIVDDDEGESGDDDDERESGDGEGESRDGEGKSRDGEGESRDGEGESRDGEGESRDGGGKSGDETDDYDWNDEMASSKRSHLTRGSDHDESVTKMTGNIEAGKSVDASPGPQRMEMEPDATSSGRRLTRKRIREEIVSIEPEHSHDKGITGLQRMEMEPDATSSGRRLTRKRIQEEIVSIEPEHSHEKEITGLQRMEMEPDATSSGRHLTRKRSRDEMVVNKAAIKPEHSNNKGLGIIGLQKKEMEPVATSVRRLTQQRIKKKMIAKNEATESESSTTKCPGSGRIHQKENIGSVASEQSVSQKRHQPETRTNTVPQQQSPAKRKFIVSLAPRRRRKLVYPTQPNWDVSHYRDLRRKSDTRKPSGNEAVVVRTSSGKFVISETTETI